VFRNETVNVLLVSVLDMIQVISKSMMLEMLRMLDVVLKLHLLKLRRLVVMMLMLLLYMRMTQLMIATPSLKLRMISKR